MGESAKSSKCRTFKVGGSLPLGKCRKTQSEEFRSYLKERKVRKYLSQEKYLKVINYEPFNPWKQSK